MNDRRLAIIVMGVSGCGKSSVGRALAGRFACPLLEGDAFHSAANIEKMRAGVPLDDDDRWPWLDRLGAALGEAAAAESLAVAACSALKHAYRDRLRAAARCPIAFVHLAPSRAELERRLRARSGHFMPMSLLDSQLAALEAPGGDELAHAFDGSGTSDELIDEAADWLVSIGVRARA